MADPRVVTTVPARLRPVLDLPPAQRTEQQPRTWPPPIAPSRRCSSRRATRWRRLEKEDSEAGNRHHAGDGREDRRSSGLAPPCTFAAPFLSLGDKVCAGVPFILNPMPDDQMPNRLGLANWLVSDDNPLDRARRRQSLLGAVVRPRHRGDQRGFRHAGRARPRTRSFWIGWPRSSCATVGA